MRFKRGFRQIMKRVFLIALTCAALHTGVSTQTHGGKQTTAQQQEAQKSEESSPELVEAQKLSVEVVKLFNAGKFDEATRLAKRALQIREKAVKPGHPLIEASLINLGELYRAKENYGEAESYYQRLLIIYEQAAMPDQAAIASVLDRLAYLKYMQSDFGKAEKLYLRALALREEANGPEHLEVATSLYNLAEFHRLRGNYSKAEPFYQRAIEIKGNQLGPDDKEVVKALEHYSCLYYAMNQHEKLKEIRNQFSFLRAQDAAIVDKGEVLNGKALSLPKPAYPGDAMVRRVSGIVLVKVTIDETGKVIATENMCGAHPLLLDAAKEAALKARFTPTLLSGVPVRVTGVITYRFVAR